MSKGHLQRKGVVRQIRWERELLSMVDSLLGQLVDGWSQSCQMEVFMGKPEENHRKTIGKMEIYPLVN